jgi:FkbM family methyltransferase
MDNVTSRLEQAMLVIGQDSVSRRKVISLCLDVEKNLKLPQGSVRDELTGALVDAMHHEGMVLEKTLADGTRFKFLYRTKIARDFVMSEPETPDHVWEPQTTKLLLILASTARNALIGGAYCGDQVILMAKRMTANGGICHAFEPNPDQLSMLRQNAELNGLGNIQSWRLGLWSNSDSHLTLVGDDSFASAVEGAADNENGFATITVDDYVAQQKLPGLDLIMLDIEGAELAVLKGARGVLSAPTGVAPNVVFEVHRHYVDWSNGLGNTEVVKMMREFGYHVFAIRDFNSNVDMTGKLIELIPPEDVYLEGPPHGFNMLAIKDLNLIHNASFRMCHHVSPKLLRHKSPVLHHPLD